MNRTEIKNLLTKISAYKPAQQLNLLTAPAWFEALGDYEYADADRAVVELAGEVQWIGVHEVKQRIKHYRGERVERGFADLIPPADAIDPVVYAAWSRQARKRLANGETADEVNGVTFAQLPAHDVRPMLGACR